MRFSEKTWRGLVTLCVVLIMQKGAFGQPTPVNLKMAIEMAIANNNNLKADSMSIIAAGYQADVYRSALLPQVNFNTRTEYNPAIASTLMPGSMVGQPAKDLVAVKMGTRYSMSNGIEVTQNLVRNDVRLQIEGAKLEQNIVRSKFNLTKEELVYSVVSSFYGLQAKMEEIRITSGDLVNMKEILTISKAQYENGIVKRIDYESLQINVANKQSYLNRLQTQYNDQLAYFNYLLGIPADAQTSVDDNLPGAIALVNASGQVFQREDIQLYYKQMEAKKHELKLIRAEGMPTVSSYFRFNYNSQYNQIENSLDNDYWFKSSSIGITTTIPLFDGHRRRNKAKVTIAQLEELKFQTEQQKAYAQSEQISAAGKLRNNVEEYHITKQNLALASKVFISRKALYAEGVTTLIELLDAERELSDAQNLHIQALINTQTSLVNVHKANGTLLTDFLKSL